ncbi:hypothetical protein BRM3_09005 [Brachybacterium huguangmaarense]|uniref:Uncharacterized protein n=1 Tax=Brachybacterium huguangmaarense TaxID=1652028 RepID=A0ABY6FXY3_9MICO|nr:hypothetical protein [Brachybacterium huguangmaarense]UYG15783.1 hypothetical protein BRM3_09005 [Brachybacterium huguangmaarense]
MNRGIVHAEPHPYAGETVPLLSKDSRVGDTGPAAMFRVTDWADRVYGKPWRLQKSIAVTVYAHRATQLGLPITDDNILHGRLLGVPILIHTREIDWSRL